MPVRGFARPVTMQCFGSPSPASCHFDPDISTLDSARDSVVIGEQLWVWACAGRPGPSSASNTAILTAAIIVASRTFTAYNY